MKRIEKVTLVGLGAIGAFFAPGLGETLGENFRVLAGGARKERLDSQGITVNGIRYHFHTVEPGMCNDPADLVIVSVKNTGLTQALADMRGQVGPDTIILPVLNGVDSEEQTAAVYGWDHVLYALMRVSVVMKDGCASYEEGSGAVLFGERDNTEYSQRVLAVKEIFDRCGICCRIPQDMIFDQWYKFMANVGENMTCALLGIPFGAFRESEHANAIRHAAMREVASIANAKGIALSEKEMQAQDEIVVKLRYENKPSTLQDLEAGRRTEVEMFAGTVLRMGRELGIATPVCEMFLHGIHVLEEKNSGKFDRQGE